MSSLWHHVSIPAEVDGFVIPSPAWLPRFVHVLVHSLSLHPRFLPRPRVSLSLATEISIARRDFFFAAWSGFGTEIISEKEREERKREARRDFRRRGVEWIRDGNNFRKRERREEERRGEISFSLFFSSFSHSLLLFLTFFLARASLSLSLATEISVARRDFFFSLLSRFWKYTPDVHSSQFLNF